MQDPKPTNTGTSVCGSLILREPYSDVIVCVQLVRTEDMVESSEVEWYFPIDCDAWRLEMFQTTRFGRSASRTLAWLLEKVGIAPEGTSSVSGFLEKGQDALCEAGRKGIFTPLYLVVARKPLTGETITTATA
jgi:sterol 24-C-methyltransferase